MKNAQINAAARLIVAEGEWFDALTDDMKKQYIEEHPDSKYAKGYKLSRPHEPVKPKPMQQIKQPPQGLKLDRDTEQKLQKLPKSAQKFVKSGGTKANSKSRKRSAARVRADAPKLARGIIKDSIGIAGGLAAMHRMLEFRPDKGDYKKAASFVGTLLGTSAMMGVLGASGPVGFLAFMAVKHVAAPTLYNIVKDGLSAGKDLVQKKKRDPYNKDFGYWKDDDTWVPLSEDEYDKLTDEEVDQYRKTGKDPTGRFKEFEDRHSRHVPEEGEDNYGFWENGKWHPQTEEEWKRPKDVSHAALRLASLLTATDEEKQLTDVIKALSDYVESGEIPDKAWKAAIAEMDHTLYGEDSE